ncbi:MAG: 23S rRNA (adenine(2503)-C(2))-methyltransferase RlmN [Deltaproteobacteria bacterium]|nr:23S rRNA (adenine(2503)-C(2))-methyltransferase RlmN [Deltaproteobacteria bacterium]MBW1931971.1 23S rRNA (adenine(2503)-C(2))-methyltransferase RlmN [Deltaproteobacteria bacterium]MBW1964438.1 23S rRNA (adenine(2503)-C(2))-methyltransferase RlmN [Deltaproteobacteria bacterium]MBW2080252.1 23S rRNA (adenine(2503)-C(2))-methyltransferase RlmN [Deltaproteobacteria bacterium]MBW2349932.1 23S rRNA (adenine(2503)-C(2))-methyltransferase RlmN [Deltaproteobacteria bacterium]
MIDFRSLSRSDLEIWARDLGLPAFRGRQLFSWFWKPGFLDFSQMTDFPKALREKAAQKGMLTNLKLVTKQSSIDGTSKLAWRLPDGLVVESVVIPERGHNTLCISSQVGCVMGCRFCHTARMGFRRHLMPSEIVGQVLAALEHIGKREQLRNLVFMGMGEPLANYGNVLKSIYILTDDLGLNFSLRRMTVSTCGLIPEILRLGQDTDVGLAVSLNAPDDKIRDKIMPINRRYPLSQLIEACRNYRLSRRRRITFEYLLLAGVNDSVEQAISLAKLLKGISSKINLIPYNESSDIPFKRPVHEQVLAFQQVLREANYTTIIRKSKGRDISAACGQLYAEIKQPK